MNPLLFLFGNARLYADAANRTALLNLCLKKSVSYTGFCACADGGVSFVCSARSAKTLLCLAGERGIDARVIREGGLPHLARKYRRRVGLFLGLLLGAALFWLSGRFVWSVQITGNENVPASEIREELKKSGLGVGSYIPAIRTEEVETRTLIRSEKIAWISVYLDGTAAVVQVREHLSGSSSDSGKPANLVSSADGQIEMIELYRGNCLVGVGQAVRRGELLVSGVYDSRTVGFRYTRAAGRILARTGHTYEIRIPLSYTQKEYGKEKRGGVWLNFFDFSLKILKNSSKTAECCDIIEDEKGWCLPGGRVLPFGVTRERILPYTETVKTRTPKEALSMAYAELERRLSALSGESQLLEKRIKTEIGTDAVVLTCTVECVENIAIQTEFEIGDLP